MSKQREDDIVSRMVTHGIEQGLWSERVGRMIEEEMRKEFGGEDDLYIARASWRDRLERDAAVRADLARGASVRDVASKYCIGKSTVQRIRDTA